MTDAWIESSSRVLAALADLSPTGEQAAGGLAVPTDWFRWLDLDWLRIMSVPSGGLAPRLADQQSRAWQAMLPEERAMQRQMAAAAQHTPADLAAEIDQAFGERLASVAQIRVTGSPLRVGWLWVAGHVPGDRGERRRVFHPLVSVPVRVDETRRLLEPVGDPVVSELVTDAGLRRRFEGSIPTHGPGLKVHGVSANGLALQQKSALREYALALAAAAGLSTTTLAPAHDGPDEEMAKGGLRVLAGLAVFAATSATTTTRSGALRAWAGRKGSRCWTAFDSLYLTDDAPDLPSMGSHESPLVLTPTQQQALVSAATQPVTVIAGAPGTGKSHTIAAIALDALARGEDVLLAAKSDATVDALIDLLERAPGPDPVVFGGAGRRLALAARLGDGQLRPAGDEELHRAAEALDVALGERWDLATAIDQRLAAEAAETSETAHLTARALAPGLFEVGAPLDDASHALSTMTAGRAGGWWARRRATKAERRLRVLTGAAASTSIESLRRAVEVAHATTAAAGLRASGGLELGATWDELRAIDDRCHDAAARWLALHSRDDRAINRRTLAAVSAMATALRSGREVRRQHLARIPDERLTQALPLWVGTLADIEDLLPVVPGLFDLVILDEASSIDQALAAPALLRGGRAVVVGDPRQLRHVSFLSDERQAEVDGAHSLDDDPGVRAVLDVRRNSAYDVAAGCAPVIVLDEHFRSDPHLVQFVADRLYGGAVKIATRSPRTQSIDCVDLVRLAGDRDADGVVRDEVAWVVSELRRLWRSDQRGIGVISPFRAQADAIEAAVLATFSSATLAELDLRVGTVHGFQGNERDRIIVSLGVGEGDPAASWRFIDDPHLFAVMMTRARRHLTIVHSASPPRDGLLADYLAQQDVPPGPPPSVAGTSTWAEEIAEDLRAEGVDIVVGYPTGRHVVDLATGGPARAVAIECAVHPGGPAAHIRRHLALRRQGWEILEAYPSKWGDRRGELVVELLRQLKQPGPDRQG